MKIWKKNVTAAAVLVTVIGKALLAFTAKRSRR